MSVELSVEQILANLETQMDLHRRQKDHHAEQESFHREQCAVHTAELEAITRNYEVFKEAAGAAVEMAARLPAPAKAPVEETLPLGASVIRSRLVARVVAERPASEPFTASSVAAEVNRRFRRALKKPANARLASAALRRLLANGTLRLAKKGAPHHESLYTKVLPGDDGPG